jgi:hypothetical protein
MRTIRTQQQRQSSSLSLAPADRRRSCRPEAPQRSPTSAHERTNEPTNQPTNEQTKHKQSRVSTFATHLGTNRYMASANLLKQIARPLELATGVSRDESVSYTNQVFWLLVTIRTTFFFKRRRKRKRGLAEIGCPQFARKRKRKRRHAALKHLWFFG